MITYEIMAIIKSDLSESDAKNYFQEGIIDRIKNHGGATSFEDFWGSRGFAYKIKQYVWGYYCVAQFTLSAEKLQEMRHELNIDTQILRTLITKVEKDAPAPRKYADMKKEYEAQEKGKKGEAEKAAAPTREKLTTVAETPKKEAPAKKDAVDALVDDSAASI